MKELRQTVIVSTILGLILLGVWEFILIGTALLKIYDASLATYFTYFTNWSWTLYVVFYALVIEGYAFYQPLLRSTIVYLFFLVHGNAWTVWIVLMGIYLTNPEFLMEAIEENSGGLVIFGSNLYHVVPLFAIILFIAGHLGIIIQSISEHLNSIRYVEVRVLWYIWYLLGNALFVGLYALVRDPRRVYTPDFPLWAGIFMVLLVTLIVNGFSIYYFYWSGGTKIHLIPREKLMRNKKEK